MIGYTYSRSSGRVRVAGLAAPHAHTRSSPIYPDHRVAHLQFQDDQLDCLVSPKGPTTSAPLTVTVFCGDCCYRDSSLSVFRTISVGEGYTHICVLSLCVLETYFLWRNIDLWHVTGGVSAFLDVASSKMVSFAPTEEYQKHSSVPQCRVQLPSLAAGSNLEMKGLNVGRFCFVQSFVFWEEDTWI